MRREEIVRERVVRESHRSRQTGVSIHSRLSPCTTSEAPLHPDHERKNFFGVLLAVLPGPGILALVWLIGAYAVVSGVLLIILAFRVRNRDESEGLRASRVR